METANAMLPEIERRLHRALLEGLLTTGAVPTRAALVAATGIALDELSARLAVLAAADYLAFDAEGRLTCLYPLSGVPTPHIVTIGEWRRYAMCAIDALGIAAMLRRAVAIDGRCAGCGASIALDIKPGTVARAAPPEAVVVARRGGNEPAVATCCPFTVFACHPDHGRELVARMPGTSIVPLPEALAHAEDLFGDLLADTLPARRRRLRDTA